MHKRFVIFRELLSNTRRITALMWKEKRGAMIALAFVFIMLSAAPFAQNGARGLLINDLTAHAGNGNLALVTVFIVALLIFSIAIPALLSAIQGYLIKLFYLFLEERIDTIVLSRKGDLDIAIHENPKYNNLLANVSENSWRVRNFVDREFYFLQNILEVLIAATILLIAKWWLFLIILIGALPELIRELRYGYEIWGIYGARAEDRRRYWDLRTHFDKTSSIMELKLFQNVKHILSLVSEIFHTFLDEQRAKERKGLLLKLLTLSISQLSIAFATVWFVAEVIDGNLLVGTALFFLGSIGDMQQALSGLFMNLGRQYQDSLFITDLFKVLDLPPAIKNPQHPLRLSSNETPEIEFENVSFTYPDTDRPVLKHFSLRIAPGEKIALVGVNGAGKTTFVKLLCRFYDPTEGRILINGTDLRDIDLKTWHTQLGVLFQEYNHYHFPVDQMIALGRSEEMPDESKIVEAAQTSEADTFIRQWPHGYKQMLGKEFTDGIEPSIGQWQKLALARLFYRDPHIFVLDEPTASIDAEAEANIFNKLEALPANRTTILISHRFSTVRKAQQIVIIENGEISEHGTHEALIAQNGTYARLFNLQAKGYK